MKKILGLLIALGISIPAFASITVSPTRMEINANKVRNNYVTTAIEIKGDDAAPTRYRVYSGYFKMSERGEMVMIDSGKGDERDISKSIRYVPSEFTVPPGKSQKLRVNIANIKSLPDGESRAMLYIEDVNSKELNMPNNYGIGAQLILKSRVGVPIYVDKGNFKKSAVVEYFNIVQGKDGLYTETKVASTGNSKIRYSGIIQIAQGKKLIGEYQLDSKVVCGGITYVAKQKIETKSVKQPGEYTLRLILSYADENNNKKVIKKDAILNITGEKI